MCASKSPKKKQNTLNDFFTTAGGSCAGEREREREREAACDEAGALVKGRKLSGVGKGIKGGEGGSGGGGCKAGGWRYADVC